MISENNWKAAKWGICVHLFNISFFFGCKQIWINTKAKIKSTLTNFLIAFVLIHICLHQKMNEILKRWTQVPHFVAFQLFSDIKKTFFFLFCTEIRFFSFSEQCKNLIFYVQRVLVLIIIFLVWNSVFVCLIFKKKKKIS